MVIPDKTHPGGKLQSAVQLKRDVYTWIPHDQIDSPDHANIWLGNEIKDATMKAMNELGIGKP